MPDDGTGDWLGAPTTDRYEIRARVGQGAMGVVFRARDREVDRDVALKTLSSPDPENLFRLKREFRMLADLRHENLVELFELVVDDRQCFLTMEWIDGGDFLAFAREQLRAGEPGFERIRDGIRQLALGLVALHGANKLHRDIKPSNVMVERSGRVVLLDFGLVSGTTSQISQASRHGAFVGTFHYMAPEQAWGEAITPAADLYSVGVMLYECLSGRLPYEGSNLAALLSRKAEPPPDPRSLGPRVPEDLSAMALELLAEDPSARPSAASLVRQLLPVDTAPLRDATRAREPLPPFVDRARELQVLRDTLAATRSGSAATIRVTGVSGIGKSSLVDRFLAETAEAGDALILRSRCRPQESVQFQALDGVVDELSRHLVRQSPEQLQALAPRNLAALVRVFPVLGRVPFQSPTSAGNLGRADLHEVRRRAFGALRELLARIADRRPLILWIDDLQWGDLDSAPLLRDLVRPPDPPCLLLLESYRHEDRDTSPLLVAIRDPDESAQSKDSALDREIVLEPLAVTDAHALMTELLGERGEELSDQIGPIAVEAAGSPFFIGQLARSLLSADEPIQRDAASGFLLSDVVADRVRQLDAASRSLLEVVSVAGEPLERSLALGAAGVGEAGRSRVADLHQQSLLRYTTVAGQAALEIYHDRIREEIIAGLGDAEQRAHHRALLAAFERRADTPPDRLARHAHGAGELAKAAVHVADAGDLASAALAFARAAELYGLALEWGTFDAANELSLLSRRAEALANTGRAGEAAPLFLQAATEAEPAESRELRRRSTEQYLVSGRIDEGVAVLEPLLRELGLRYPRSQRAALLGTLARLVQLMARGIRFRTRDEADVAVSDLTRIDTCYSAAKGLVAVDTVRGGLLAIRGLLLALACGEPRRVGRSLAMVGGAVLAPAGGFVAAWGRRMIDAVRDLGRDTGDPYLIGIASISGGQIEVFSGRWRAALESSETGIALLREHCRGVTWECNIGHMGELRGLEELGRMRECLLRAERLRSEAEELGDLYGEITAAAYVSIARIAAGEPDWALGQHRASLERWAHGAFDVQHLYVLRAEAFADVYRGDPERAWERVQEAWQDIERSFLLRVPVTRIDSILLRARIGLALAARAGAEQAARLRDCEADARRLEKEKRNETTAHAALLRAGIACVRGQRSEALALLETAKAAYAQESMLAYRATALLRHAQLSAESGPERERQLAAAQEFLVKEGIAQPLRWAEIYAPGLGPLPTT